MKMSYTSTQPTARITVTWQVVPFDFVIDSIDVVRLGAAPVTVADIEAGIGEAAPLMKESPNAESTARNVAEMQKPVRPPRGGAAGGAAGGRP